MACLFVVLFLVSNMRYGHGERIKNVVSSDPGGYYMYLPTIFVDEGIHHINRDFTGWVKNEKGEIYIKYTCGVALFYLPFFLAAHLYAHITHTNASGYAPPYYYGIMLCGVFWAVAGTWLLKTLLRQYFSRGVTWLTLLCIVAGTNYFNYATLEIGMSHVYNFALFAAAALIADKYYKRPGTGKAMLFGLVLGWIVLIRPTNIMLLLFLLLFRVVTWRDLVERMEFLKKHIGHILLAVLFFIIIWIPQLLYWKEMTGHWISYSYDHEQFIYWTRPKILAVLADTQNGLLLYSPILLFIFWAIIARRKDPRTNAWGTGLVFIIITYIFASWWAWWFGGAFGHRCYVDYYPLFAFPMAVAMEAILNTKKLYAKIPAIAGVLLFCYYSVAMSQIYMVNSLPWDGEHWRWNWDGWLGLVRSIF